MSGRPPARGRPGDGRAAGRARTAADERTAQITWGLPARETLGVAASLVVQVIQARPLTAGTVTGVTLGLPTSLDTSGKPVTRKFRGLDVARLAGLADLGIQVSVMNDADLGALGEAVYGAGRRFSDFMYIKMRRGIGAGLVLGQRGRRDRAIQRRPLLQRQHERGDQRRLTAPALFPAFKQR